jgi:hypothetical protein
MVQCNGLPDVSRRDRFSLPRLPMASLVRHEGNRADVYDDATGQSIVACYTVVGTPTTGIGRNATAGRRLSPAERLYLANNDISVCVSVIQQSWYGLVAPCEPCLWCRFRRKPATIPI